MFKLVEGSFGSNYSKKILKFAIPIFQKNEAYSLSSAPISSDCEINIPELLNLKNWGLIISPMNYPKVSSDLKASSAGGFFPSQKVNKITKFFTTSFPKSFWISLKT